MPMDATDARLAFLSEAARLREVERASRTGSGRRENSAEHSWHLALYAMALGEEEAPDGVNVDRAIRMLLIHDLVEIDVGDVPLHGARPENHDAAEDAAAERIFGLLPGAQGEALLALWREFEAARTPDARFAKALDRLQPVLLNLETGGGTWPDFNVGEAEVLARCGPPIETGAPALWPRVRDRVKAHFTALVG
ncbi:HD domain-containing protein [Albimonas pacifica]|uniref:Putative hydrolases of HD superfamily n=1 Tax=Albimonas pacifica TaxID=1114924 RepID=A0A1I3GG23_9RHOB|nr:HD domain-containing protein [Albimonas pacifica]SFI22202.1 putative hydrolases of HD superfamily [Albimonas pacifica]